MEHEPGVTNIGVATEEPGAGKHRAYTEIVGRKIFFASLLIECVLALGCGDFARWLRPHTYPPDFRYVTRDQIRSTMWQLAYHSRELNQLMRSPEMAQQHRTEIGEHLRAMEQAAANLDQSGWPTNHPLVDMNLANFRRDLKFARESVERGPPNFLLAAPLSGACVYCHGGGQPGNR